ncbi:hypothetical protein AusDCA_2803 [Desulfitobacterium sp. AusDCA]
MDYLLKANKDKENPASLSLSEGKAAGCTYAGRKYKTEGYTF